jgi:flagellin-like hook-associated protein FlgL
MYILDRSTRSFTHFFIFARPNEVTYDVIENAEKLKLEMNPSERVKELFKLKILRELNNDIESRIFPILAIMLVLVLLTIGMNFMLMQKINAMQHAISHLSQHLSQLGASSTTPTSNLSNVTNTTIVLP